MDAPLCHQASGLCTALDGVQCIPSRVVGKQVRVEAWQGVLVGWPLRTCAFLDWLMRNQVCGALDGVQRRPSRVVGIQPAWKPGRDYL